MLPMAPLSCFGSGKESICTVIKPVEYVSGSAGRDVISPKDAVQIFGNQPSFNVLRWHPFYSGYICY